jgi:cytochrome c5
MKAASKAAVTMACAWTLFATAAAADGKAVYAQICAACHATGVAQAPKLGDKSAWAARIGKGRDTLFASVLKGKGAMPPKGGNASLSDDEARSAVEFMLTQAR